jgi:hypothetical protein
MTFPSGAPGGYPGQGPYQPQPGPGYGPPPHQGGGLKLSLAQILALVAGGAGVLNLFMGFAPVTKGIGFYESMSAGWIPVLLAIGGLLQLPVFLPGDNQKPGIMPVAVSLGATLGFLFTVFSFSGSLAAGGILVLILGIAQSGAAIGAYLLDIGVIKPPAPNPYGPPGSYPQQPGYPQTGGFPQQQQQQQPPQPGPTGQFGAPPAPGQQTQFAPQQGQFGQAPGTPPGGYPQQQQPPQY